MKLFLKLDYSFQPLTDVTKNSILHVAGVLDKNLCCVIFILYLFYLCCLLFVIWPNLTKFDFLNVRNVLLVF